MDKIKVIHDAVSETLTVWIDDPNKEHVCEESIEEVVFMKDSSGKIIGFEMLHFVGSDTATGLSVESILKTGSRKSKEDAA
jgi:uncharacterized protein YuzE